MQQQTFLLIVVFVAIIFYQQYLIYSTQQEVSNILVRLNEQPLQKLYLQDLPPVNLANNVFLKIKSPLPRTGKKVIDSKVDGVRGIFGGKGDAAHLGGFTQRDNSTISENLWNFLLSQVAIKSVIDVGCGKGFSTSYFLSKGARVLCVEGSQDAIANSLLPSDKIVPHDFAKGAWWPEETFDMAWSTEFLEHVGRQYMKNYLPVFAKSALILVSASGWGGWHHVEVHDQKWWIARFQSSGFIFSRELTEWFRSQSSPEFENNRQAQTVLYGLLVRKF